MRHNFSAVSLNGREPWTFVMRHVAKSTSHSCNSVAWPREMRELKQRSSAYDWEDL